MKRSNALLSACIALAATTFVALPVNAVLTTFVSSNGAPVNVVYNPSTAVWTQGAGYITETGTGKYLFGGINAGAGNFHIYSQLSINIAGTASCFCFGTASHFGWDGGSDQLFYEGPLLGNATISLAKATNYIQSNVPFEFEVVRAGANVSFLINGTNVFTYTNFTTGDPGQVGFRPWRAIMNLYNFSIDQPVAIANLQPAAGCGSLYYNPTNGFSFDVLSDNGVASNSIQLVLNGQNLSSQLLITGSSTNWSCSLPAQDLGTNLSYTGQIIATDLSGDPVTNAVSFDTFIQPPATSPDVVTFIEGGDYNFNAGQFIDDVVLSSSDNTNNYLDQPAVQGIDANSVKTPTSAIYRIGDIINTGISEDCIREEFEIAQQTDSGVQQYYAGPFVQDEWLNYTRILPTNYYTVWARYSETGTPSFTAQLGLVTNDPTSTGQMVSPLGTFAGPATSAATSAVNPVATPGDDFAQMTDVFGNPIAVPLGGQTTLRFSPEHGATTFELAYFTLAPQINPVQPPFVAGVVPALSSSNEVSTPAVGATILNGTTSIEPGSVHLLLDGADITSVSTLTPISTVSASGVAINYQVANALSMGQHLLQLTYSDTSSKSFSNQWTFQVANQAVYGFWQFLEGTNGAHPSTNFGAILDSSGNDRNGTAENNTTMYYTNGSPSYGGTPAMHFSGTSDWVMVPDPAYVFNFRGALTFEAVVRTTNTATTPAILAKNAGTTSEGEYWWRAPGTSAGVQRVAFEDDRTKGEPIVPGTIKINDGNWHHLAVVLDTNQQQIRTYVDYNLDSVSNNVNLTGIIGWSTNLFLGNFVGGGDPFGGDINFIRISAGALATNQFIQPIASLPPYITVDSPPAGDLNVGAGSEAEVTLVNRTTQLVLSTLHITLNGIAVPTSEITVTTNGEDTDLSWSLPTNLVAGAYTVIITAEDNGVPVNTISNSWSFTVAENALVRGYWQFDEQLPNGGSANETPGAIVDQSGNGRNLTAFGNPAPYYVPSSGEYRSPSALHFTTNEANALRAGLALAPAFDFGANDSFTLEADIRVNPAAGSGGDMAIVSKDYGSALPSWWFRINGSALQFLISDGPNQPSVQGGIPINDGNWHHVAAVRDAVNRQLAVYVDYQLDNQANDTTVGSLANTNDMSIAAFNLNEPGRDFPGDIDFVRISGAALTPSQFLQQSIPVPFDIAKVAGQFQFSFQSTAGSNYVIQETGSLNPQNWTNVATIVGDGTVWTNIFPFSGPASFFRINTP
ncbi:MAG TPA: LamG-like jellyroll fold domain-containing protein [Verrucomicrobiae bacterium]|jgi:hypothetical protein|nr:LamG-like jellyroll fold domain-containing protein [Verrucomicrobiae bacterium]